MYPSPPDHGKRRSRFRRWHHLTHRTAVREQLPRHKFINDRHTWRTGLIIVGECSTRQQWDTHRREVLRTDGARGIGRARHANGSVDSGEWQVIHNRDCLRARHLLHALQNLAIVCDLARPRVCTCFRAVRAFACPPAHASSKRDRAESRDPPAASAPGCESLAPNPPAGGMRTQPRSRSE